MLDIIWIKREDFFLDNKFSVNRCYSYYYPSYALELDCISL